MKISCIVISAVLLFTVSCKKENVPADLFQATMGSTSFTFDSTYAAIDNGNPYAYFVTVFGKDTKTGNVFYINAQSVPKTKVAGTYPNTASTLAAQYNILNAGFIITGGPLSGSYRTNNQFSFTLELEIPGNDRLQGSFAGKLEWISGTGSLQSSDMIKGQFKIPFKFIP